MAALSAASFRMESGIWFFTNRFGRGRVDCCSCLCSPVSAASTTGVGCTGRGSPCSFSIVLFVIATETNNTDAYK